MSSIVVEWLGQTCVDFPWHSIDPCKKTQAVYVAYFQIGKARYSWGEFAVLEKADCGRRFNITRWTAERPEELR